MPTVKHQLSHAVLDCLYLCTHSEWHRKYTVDDFKRYFLYPILHDKIILFHEENKPIGLVTWCFLPSDLGEEFLNGDYVLDEEDYLAEEGEELWAVEFIAPFGHTAKVMRGIRHSSDARYGPKMKIHWKRLGRSEIKHKGVM
jgi:hemolysin-activating ACP:hemolysin acyltransferase